MNPFDVLDYDGIDSPEKLREALAARLDTAGPGQRDALRRAIERIAQEPAIIGIWLLTSRHGGRPHPFDRALAGLDKIAAPDLEAPGTQQVEENVQQSIATGDQREAILKELVELPALDEEALYLKGLQK